MRIATLCAASLLLVSAAAGAVQTRGGVTCDQWLTDSKANAWEIVADHFWLLGYLSGLAVGLDKDLLKGSSNQAIYAWMDTYCVTNPLKSTGDAANVLARELGNAGNGSSIGSGSDNALAKPSIAK